MVHVVVVMESCRDRNSSCDISEGHGGQTLSGHFLE